LPILTGALEKVGSVIHIIKYEDPISLPVVAQPVVHKLEYVGLWILPPGDLDAVCYLSKALLKASCVACVDPENPRFWRSVSGFIRVGNGELRLASQQLALEFADPLRLTQRRPGRRAPSEILHPFGGFD
jgi:hypothetical protein